MSKIEWTDETWNPFVGCSKISPACNNCYAEGMARRLANMQATSYYAGAITDGKWNGNICAAPESVWEKPEKWHKPRRIFVGSMTDVFHPNVLDALLDRLFMEMTVYNSHHTYMLLTKRPERMRDYIAEAIQRDADWVWQGCTVSDKSVSHSWCSPPPLVFKAPDNVWLGVTVENQEQADARIPVLLDTLAATRFVSIEPMLGPVDLNYILPESSKEPSKTCGTPWGHKISALHGTVSTKPGGPKSGPCFYPSLDWIIAGGESGPNARPSHPDWVRDLRDQCVKAEVPFFFKQWGEWAPDNFVHAGTIFDREHITFNSNYEIANSRADFTPSHNFTMKHVGKKAAGHLLDGMEWRQVPE